MAASAIDLAASRGALAGRAGRGRGVGGRRRHAAIHATLRQDGRNSRPLARPAQLTPALSYQASKRARSVPVGGHSGAERSQRARFREAFSVGAAVFATDLAADVALRGTSDTDATNSVTTSATSLADLGDHITRLITRLKRRERHGLGRCGKRQGKSNGGQPEHFFLPCRSFKKSHNLEAIIIVGAL